MGKLLHLSHPSEVAHQLVCHPVAELNWDVSTNLEMFVLKCQPALKVGLRDVGVFLFVATEAGKPSCLMICNVCWLSLNQCCMLTNPQ